MTKIKNVPAELICSTYRISPLAKAVYQSLVINLAKSNRKIQEFSEGDREAFLDKLSLKILSQKEIFFYFNNDDSLISIEDNLEPEWKEEYRQNHDIKIEKPKYNITFYLMID